MRLAPQGSGSVSVTRRASCILVLLSVLRGRKMLKLDKLGWAALVVVIAGALNWGLVGMFGFDFLEALFGEASMISRILYMVTGLAGIYAILEVVTTCKRKMCETHHTHPA